MKSSNMVKLRAPSAGALMSAVGMIALALLLSTSPLAAVAAGAVVTVKTDQSSYSGAQALLVSGTVSPTPSGNNAFVVISVKGPGGAQVLYNEGAVSLTNGSFSLRFVTGGPNWAAGTYVINATFAPYGSSLTGWATTTFIYSPSETTTSSIASSTSTTTSSTSSTAATTTTHSSTSMTMNSTTIATTASTSPSSTSVTTTQATTSLTTSASGGGIPEFPFQLVTVVLFTASVAAAYVVARSRARSA